MLIHDAGSLATSPIRWKPKQYATFAGALAGGLALYAQDEKIRTWMQKQKHPFLTQASRYGLEPLGSGLYPAILLSGLYAGGRLSHNQRLTGTVATAAESFVFASIFTQCIKQATHRHRPFQDSLASSGNWEGPLKGFDFTSFPSGHTTAAFSIASVFADEYAHTVWVPAVAYGLAGAVGLSRIYDDKHWSSDVWIGAAIGTYTGIMLHREKRKALHIMPMVMENYSGMTVVVDLGIPQKKPAVH